MGSLKGVDITKGSIGPSSQGPATSPSAIISNAPAIEDTLVVNTIYEVKSVKQAEALGITPVYDIENDVVLHRHIVDFFSMAGEGVSLRIMVVDAEVPADVFTDEDITYARKLIIAAQGAVRNLSLAWNVAPDADPETLLDGFNADVRSCIDEAQAFAEWTFSTDRPVHILIEGRRLSDTLSAALNLRSIEAGDDILSATKVSIVAGQDWQYAEDRKNNDDADANTKVQYYAAVGKALGTVAAADMNQSIAEVSTFNLSDATLGYFSTAGLSNHKKISEVEDALQDLDDNGYIFPILFPSVSGYRWNNDHCCTPIVIDDAGNINEHMIYYSRTIDDAAMRLKAQLTLLVKSRVSVDATTGKLSPAVIKNLEANGDQVFHKMSAAGFIVDGQTTINQDSDLVDPPKTLLASFKLVPTSILDNIAGAINLVKSFNL